MKLLEVKSYVYYEFIELSLLELYLKIFEVYIVIYFIFTRTTFCIY